MKYNFSEDLKSIREILGLSQRAYSSNKLSVLKLGESTKTKK